MNKNNKGFTLIELIIVTVILGIMSAIAVPRFMGTVNRSEAAAEDAVLDALRLNVESYAMEQFVDTGRKSYPSNPFDGADVDGYVGKDQDISSGEWTFISWNGHGYIKHVRNDDSQWKWYYSSSDESNEQADDRGYFGDRLQDGRVNGDTEDL